MSQLDRAKFSGQLKAAGIELVALTFVDNSGISRVKAVPVDALAAAATDGVGASSSFDYFLADDSIVVASPRMPVGDLRLRADLNRVTPLAAHPGWAWAPVWKYDQEGEPHPQDARALVLAATGRLAEHGLSVKAAFEIEWVATSGDVPTEGPAYGFSALSRQSGYLRDLVSALDSQGLTVAQIHPEYAQGQFEVSVSANDPLGAADDAVLVRETIRTVTEAHGLRASFTPKFEPNGVGNGGHLHLSLWRDGRNLCDWTSGRVPEAEHFAAGILDRLPALLAVGAPSVVSYLRLVPGHWAGAYRCWGVENREAPLRLIPGPAGSRERTANLEVKCFDLTANPYLVVAGVLFAGLAGLGEEAGLPEPVNRDPHGLDIDRLPTTLAEAVAAFAADDTLWTGFGEELATTLVELRRRDVENAASLTADEICAAARWRY